MTTGKENRRDRERARKRNGGTRRTKKDNRKIDNDVEDDRRSPT
jgi:hypothetical protein